MGFTFGETCVLPGVFYIICVNCVYLCWIESFISAL